MSITIRIDRQPETDLNYSNRNAALVFGAIGFEMSEGYGTIPAEDIPQVRRTFLRVLNQASKLTTVLPQATLTRRIVNHDNVPIIEHGLRCFDPGIDQEGVVRRLQEVFRLLAEANALRSGVSWY